MSNMIDFLSLPDVDSIIEEIYINDRIGTFKIKAMTNAQWESYRARCKGKMKKDGVNFDNEKFNNLVLSGHVTEPNFTDAAMLAKANCSTAAEFISKKILPGEINEIVARIVKLSGFDDDINEDVEEAKNS